MLWLVQVVVEVEPAATCWWPGQAAQADLMAVEAAEVMAPPVQRLRRETVLS